MTMASPTGQPENATPVESQRARLDEAEREARLIPEEGIGITLGAVTGGAFGLLIGFIVATNLDFDGLVRALPLIAACTVVAAILGALIGAFVVGRPARRARAEFAGMREVARREPPAEP